MIMSIPYTVHPYPLNTVRIAKVSPPKNTTPYMLKQFEEFQLHFVRCLIQLHIVSGNCVSWPFYSPNLSDRYAI